MQYNGRFLIPIILAVIGCAKEPDRVEPMVAQPIVVAEQSHQKTPSAASVATKIDAPLPTHELAPTDDGSIKLLSELMAPGAPTFPAPLQQKNAVARRLPADLVQPDPPEPANSLTPVRHPSPASAELRPVGSLERVPVNLAPLAVDAPQRIEFPVGTPSKLPAADAKQAVPLPTLARRSIDRASFADPTAEFTAQSIINNKLPLRSLPAPFVKVDLPNQSKKVEALKSKILVNEDPLTSVGNPPPPRP